MISMKSNIDRIYFENGFKLIAGIDEVGRGPLAGPVVAACVLFDINVSIPEVNDSKKLSMKKRKELAEIIKENALSIGIGIIDNNIIDEVNILEATKLAMIKALDNLLIKPDFVLVDAVKLNISYPNESIIKGDEKSMVIAASSIIAKVTRDEIMKGYHQIYPQYGFDRNSGYPTKEHKEALIKHGITPIHRISFKPVKNLFINT